jgi:hypothetical protein
VSAVISSLSAKLQVERGFADAFPNDEPTVSILKGLGYDIADVVGALEKYDYDLEGVSRYFSLSYCINLGLNAGSRL